MADNKTYITDETNYTNIANAIRTLNKTDTKYTPEEMARAIDALKTDKVNWVHPITVNITQVPHQTISVGTFYDRGVTIKDQIINTSQKFTPTVSGEISPSFIIHYSAVDGYVFSDLYKSHEVVGPPSTPYTINVNSPYETISDQIVSGLKNLTHFKIDFYPRTVDASGPKSSVSTWTPTYYNTSTQTVYSGAGALNHTTSTGDTSSGITPIKIRAITSPDDVTGYDSVLKEAIKAFMYDSFGSGLSKYASYITKTVSGSGDENSPITIDLDLSGFINKVKSKEISNLIISYPVWFEVTSDVLGQESKPMAPFNADNITSTTNTTNQFTFNGILDKTKTTGAPALEDINADTGVNNYVRATPNSETKTVKFSFNNFYIKLVLNIGLFGDSGLGRDIASDNFVNLVSIDTKKSKIYKVTPNFSGYEGANLMGGSYYNLFSQTGDISTILSNFNSSGTIPEQLPRLILGI